VRIAGYSIAELALLLGLSAVFFLVTTKIMGTYRARHRHA
jgi:hypothetical protein